MHDNTFNSKYHVVIVEKTSAPTGMSGENWYRYVIQKGNMTNTIMDCKKTGTHESVTQHADEQAETLNLRNTKGKQR